MFHASQNLVPSIETKPISHLISSALPPGHVHIPSSLVLRACIGSKIVDIPIGIATTLTIVVFGGSGSGGFGGYGSLGCSGLQVG
jgi:hypothetical protein